MNVNKKLDRFKQWAGERMGGEVKTSVSDDFKALEVEMGLRHEGLFSPRTIPLCEICHWSFGCILRCETAYDISGMEKLQKATNIYMKALSKRTDVDDKEKTLPIAFLGGTMVSHGDDFELNSEFGQCLTSLYYPSTYRFLES